MRGSSEGSLYAPSPESSSSSLSESSPEELVPSDEVESAEEDERLVASEDSGSFRCRGMVRCARFTFVPCARAWFSFVDAVDLAVALLPFAELILLGDVDDGSGLEVVVVGGAAGSGPGLFILDRFEEVVSERSLSSTSRGRF